MVIHLDHHCLDMRAIDKMLIMSSDQSPSLDDLTDENACVCCHNVSMVCPGANRMVCPAALAAPMVLLTRVVAPKVCPQMTTTTGPKQLFVSVPFIINVLQFDENNHIGNNCSL